MKTKIFRQFIFIALKKVSAHDKQNIFPPGDSVRHNIRPEHLHRLQDLQVKQVQEELQVTNTISLNSPRNIQNASFFLQKHSRRRHVFQLLSSVRVQLDDGDDGKLR